jgi:DNA-3-methyladenine glycosylase II
VIALTPPPGLPDWSPALKHLKKVDPVLGKVIRTHGPCNLAPRKDVFFALCQSIISQQISTKAANTVTARFVTLFPRKKPTAPLLAAMTPEILKPIGFGPQKAGYMLGMARQVASGELNLKTLNKLSDEQVYERLTAIHGIGRWTAEMLLMFVLGRPDILPADDLGIQAGVQRIDNLKARPTAKHVLARGEIWRPYRTIASWYLWRSHDIYSE